jgi:hypothetical protein
MVACETRIGIPVVEEASGFTVDIDWVVEPVEEGESVVTQATVENTDAERDTRTVELRIDDETVDSTEVTLDSGGSTEVTLGWDTEAGDAGDHTLTVALAAAAVPVVLFLLLLLLAALAIAAYVYVRYRSERSG